MDKLEGMELLIQQNLLLHDHTILLTGHRLQCSAGNNIGQSMSEGASAAPI